jgi:hypothetical protein
VLRAAKALPAEVKEKLTLLSAALSPPRPLSRMSEMLIVIDTIS